MVDPNKLIEAAEAEFEEVELSGQTIARVKHNDEWVDIEWSAEKLREIDSPALPKDKVDNAIDYVKSVVGVDDENEEEKAEENVEDDTDDSEVIDEESTDEEESETEATATKETADVASLPTDFPGKEELEEEGLLTLEDVREYKLDKDLTEIHGIGPATADKISDELLK